MKTATENGERLFSPSTARNREPIAEVLLDALPPSSLVLEIGGGTGEHAAYMAKTAPEIDWYTGDPDAAARTSIAAWIAHEKLPNLKGPHALGVSAPGWAEKAAMLVPAPPNAIVSINMIHIAPFAATTGLFTGAGALLKEGGLLFLYGPFSRGGVHTAPSNEAFDESLKSRDPGWGVRDIEHDLLPLAQKNALTLERIVEMPANNLSLLFRKIS